MKRHWGNYLVNLLVDIFEWWFMTDGLSWVTYRSLGAEDRLDGLHYRRELRAHG